MSHFKQHIFFCVNQRDDGRECCGAHKAEEVRGYAKQRIKALGLNGEGKVRVNTAGCMDRCSDGPVMVIYPAGVWYTYVDNADVDEIISEHIQHGRLVERLKI